MITHIHTRMCVHVFVCCIYKHVYTCLISKHDVADKQHFEPCSSSIAISHRVVVSGHFARRAPSIGRPLQPLLTIAPYQLIQSIIQLAVIRVFAATLRTNPLVNCAWKFRVVSKGNLSQNKLQQTHTHTHTLRDLSMNECKVLA